jgi:hypothetical protein
MRRDLEHQEQVALFEWVGLAKTRIPELRLLYAIPNWAGVKSPREGARRKAEGVRAGVPDLCLPVARGGFHGLYIEMKAGEKRPTKDQQAWLRELQEQGYATRVCWSMGEARAMIESYLELPEELTLSRGGGDADD